MTPRMFACPFVLTRTVVPTAAVEPVARAIGLMSARRESANASHNARECSVEMMAAAAHAGIVPLGRPVSRGGANACRTAAHPGGQGRPSNVARTDVEASVASAIGLTSVSTGCAGVRVSVLANNAVMMAAVALAESAHRMRLV